MNNYCVHCGKNHYPNCMGDRIGRPPPRCYLCGKQHFPTCKDGGKPPRDW